MLRIAVNFLEERACRFVVSSLGDRVVFCSLSERLCRSALFKAACHYSTPATVYICTTLAIISHSSYRLQPASLHKLLLFNCSAPAPSKGCRFNIRLYLAPSPDSGSDSKGHLRPIQCWQIRSTWLIQHTFIVVTVQTGLVMFEHEVAYI